MSLQSAIAGFAEAPEFSVPHGFYDAAHLKGKLELPAGVVPIMSIVFGQIVRHA